jgi:hypothetical protein
MMSTVTEEELSTASLPEIAALIVHDWDNVSSAAHPYVDAMFCINSVRDNYGVDYGRSIVAYPGGSIVADFLFSASSWRGPVAHLVKAELESRIA